MRNFDIFVDSAANLPDDLIKENDIKVISYTCLVDGQEMECYEEGVPFVETAKKFYEAMRGGAETKTTLVNADKIMTAVTPALESGRDALIITIAEGISGTYNQAVVAAKELSEKFPDRKILVSQSANASLGEGLAALYAAKLADMGESIDACHQWVEDNKFNIHGICTVDSLKYLKRGGRVSTALAIAGTILNIKPVLHGDENSKLTVFCNERGRTKSIARLVEEFRTNVIAPENQIVAIAHADCEDEANELAEKVKALGANEIIMNYYDLCTGAHAGPGTLAIFFLGKSRDKNAEKKPATSKFGWFKSKKEKKSSSLFN
ncbi:MAG: DegV family protein, partial [Clostridia bacterium]|nr:DegV family protein [Clostridia bacterium]